MSHLGHSTQSGQVAAIVIFSAAVFESFLYLISNGALDWGLEWRFHERRATLSMGWQNWRLRVGTDSLDSQARSRELGLTYLRQF